MKIAKTRKCLLLLMLAAWMSVAAAPAGTQDGEIPITTSSEEALSLYKQGRDLSERLRSHKSIKYYEKAIAEDSNFAMAYLNLAFVHIATGNPNGFWENFNKAMALVDKVSEGERLLILAVQAGADDNPTKQKDLYLQLVKAYPKDKRAHYAFGLYYFGQREYDLAIDEFKKAIGLAPDFPPPYNEFGYAYSYLGNYPEAEKALEKYAELIPDEPNPYDSWAEILMKQGKFDESIEAYKKALSLDPNFFSAYVGIGMNLIFKGKSDEGRAQFQKFHDIASTDGLRRQALFWMVVSYIDDGKFDKALEERQKGYAIAEKNNDVSSMSADLNTMGDILLETGKWDEAMAHYLKAVEVIEKSDRSKEIKDDTKQGLLYNEAHIALKKEDLVTAKSRAEEYRKQTETGHDPLEIQSYHELAGMIALYEKRYDDALRELSQANQRNPRNLCRMAQAYEGKGDKAKAKKMWMQAANFNENSYNYVFIRNKAKKRLAEM